MLRWQLGGACNRGWNDGSVLHGGGSIAMVVGFKNWWRGSFADVVRLLFDVSFGDVLRFHQFEWWWCVDDVCMVMWWLSWGKEARGGKVCLELRDEFFCSWFGVLLGGKNGLVWRLLRSLWSMWVNRKKVISLFFVHFPLFLCCYVIVAVCCVWCGGSDRDRISLVWLCFVVWKRCERIKEYELNNVHEFLLILFNFLSRLFCLIVLGWEP